jgi:hypothetical protein
MLGSPVISQLGKGQAAALGSVFRLTLRHVALICTRTADTRSSMSHLDSHAVFARLTRQTRMPSCEAVVKPADDHRDFQGCAVRRLHMPKLSPAPGPRFQPNCRWGSHARVRTIFLQLRMGDRRCLLTYIAFGNTCFQGPENRGAKSWI